MATRNQHRAWGAVGLLLLLATVTGCSATTPQATPSSASASASASEIVVPECAQLLPRDQAAALLGLSPSGVTDDPYQDDTGKVVLSTGSSMIAIARHRSGSLTCLWRTPSDTSGATSVSLHVIGGAAAEFASTQPDSFDGLDHLKPADIGDRAYFGCRTGETDMCLAEVLAGTTWFELSVAPGPHDTAATQTLARSVARVLARTPLPGAAAPARADCATLLGADALASIGPLEAGVQDLLGADALKTGGTDAIDLRRGGLSECSATFTSGDLTGISAFALKGGKAVWSDLPPGADRSTISLAPVAGLGDRAVGGCDGRDCEVDVISGQRWIQFTGFGPHPSQDALIRVAKDAVSALPRS